MAAAFDLVIFDWDGTLYDSVQQIVDSLLWAARQHDIELASEAAKNIIGLGLPEAMQALFPRHPDLHASIQAAYSQHYVAHSHTQGWFSGVDELLDGLAQNNIAAAVATGKSRAGLNRVLAHTNSAARFVATRCASETLSKPDPLMLQQILQETGIAAERAVMVGDTTYDMEMAARIGMPRIAVSYGVHSSSQLQAFQPLHVAHSIAALHDMLLGSVATSSELSTDPQLAAFTGEPG